MIVCSEAWRAAYPGAAAGFLVMRNVANAQQHDALDRRKEEVEAQLRARIAAWNADFLTSDRPDLLRQVLGR